MADQMEILRKAVQCTCFSSGAREAVSKSLSTMDIGALSGTVPTLLQAALEDAKATVSDSLANIDISASESELEECKAAVEATEEAEKLAAKVKDEAAETKEEKQKIAKAAMAEAAALKKTQQATFKALAKLREEHAKALAVAEGPAKLLAEGGWSSEEVKLASLQAVQKLLPQTKAGQDLCAAASASLINKPDERAKFDSVVIEETLKHINGLVDELQDKLDKDAMQERLAKAESYGLWAIASTETDRSDEAREAEATATETLKRASKETESARKRLKTIQNKIQSSLNEQSALLEEQKLIQEACTVLETKP